jgi:hypothetical protein
MILLWLLDIFNLAPGNKLLDYFICKNFLTILMFMIQFDVYILLWAKLFFDFFQFSRTKIEFFFNNIIILIYLFVYFFMKLQVYNGMTQFGFDRPHRDFRSGFLLLQLHVIVNHRHFYFIASNSFY